MARTAVGTNNEVLTVDQTQLIGIQMVNWPADQRGIILIYATGHDDGSGNFVPVKRKQIPIPPAEFAAFATSTPDLSAAGGFFAALKDFCYQQIQNEAQGL